MYGEQSQLGAKQGLQHLQTLNAKLYRDILDEHLIDNAWNLYPTNWYFQQDDDSKHTANKTIEFLENNVPHLLE